MATRTRQSPPADQDKDASQPPELADLIASVGGDAAYFRVYRMSTEGRLYLGKLAPEHADPDVIKERWGGGEFFVQLHNARGRPLARGSVRLQIEGPAKESQEAPAAVRPPQWAPNVPAPADSFTEMMAMMREMLRELRSPPRAAETGDPALMAMNIVNTVQAATKPLQEALLELRAPKHTDSGPDLLNAFTEGLKFARRLQSSGGGGGGGGGGEGGPLERLVDQALVPLVNKVLSGAPNGGAAGGLPPGDPPFFNWRSGFKPWVAELNRIAEHGGDPAVYADVALDRLPEGVLDPMVQELETRGSGWWDEWFQLYPETRPQESWWRAFIGAVWSPEHGDQEGDVEGATDS